VCISAICTPDILKDCVSKKAVLEFYYFSDIIRAQIAAVLLNRGIIMAGTTMGLVVRPVNP
jgi:hypothetical protein